MEGWMDGRNSPRAKVTSAKGEVNYFFLSFFVVVRNGLTETEL